MAKAEKKAKDDRPELKVYTGGKGPEDPKSTNWLKDLPKGAIFNAHRNNDHGPKLQTFQVCFNHQKSAVLAETMPNGEQTLTHYDYSRFSRDYTLHEVLMVLPQQEETETANGSHDPDNGIQDQRDRPDLSG